MERDRDFFDFEEAFSLGDIAEEVSLVTPGGSQHCFRIQVRLLFPSSLLTELSHNRLDETRRSWKTLPAHDGG